MSRILSLPQKITNLQLNIAGQRTGNLSFENGSYHFVYDHENSLPVSKTMIPKNKRFYNSGQLFPIFEMNLPEGYVRERIAERLLRYVGKVSDLMFLALQQYTGIGALSYQSDLSLPPPKPEKLEDLLKWDDKSSAFEYLINKYLLHNGISGVQPKVMLHADLRSGLNQADLTTQMESQTKGTGLLPNLIVKTSDVEYPHLAENEFICMSMAKACGISVPKCYLSDNRELFIMERFDLVNEERLGMEDFCVLSGRSRDQKYTGSYEVAGKMVQAYTNSQREVDKLFEYVTFSALCGNGDAHLKNFSLLYSFNDDKRAMRMSPMYDVVNTTCYPSHDKAMALKLNKSTSFPTHDELVKFGRELKVNKPAETIEKLADTISDHLNKAELWDDLSFLKTAISSAVSKGQSKKSLFMTTDVKREKKRKTDSLLKR